MDCAGDTRFRAYFGQDRGPLAEVARTMRLVAGFIGRIRSARARPGLATLRCRTQDGMSATSRTALLLEQPRPLRSAGAWPLAKNATDRSTHSPRSARDASSRSGGSGVIIGAADDQDRPGVPYASADGTSYRSVAGPAAVCNAESVVSSSPLPIVRDAIR
jgi:hypothetical protein